VTARSVKKLYKGKLDYVERYMFVSLLPVVIKTNYCAATWWRSVSFNDGISSAEFNIKLKNYYMRFTVVSHMQFRCVLAM
jgi:hypothetical protein